jgi:DNA-binding transcriptional ArsR family regulator
MKNIKNLGRKFKALGNERRLGIMEALLKFKKLTVGEISEKINLSFRSTSRHLKVLEGAGFVSWEQVGVNVYYFVSPEAPREFLELVKKLV